MPTPTIRDVYPSSSDVSKCPSPNDALYSQSIDFPGYGTVLFCYTRVSYHPIGDVEDRPLGASGYNSTTMKGIVSDLDEWPNVVSSYAAQMGNVEASVEADVAAGNQPAGLMEWSVNTVGVFDALQAIKLPNGKAWQFKYDTSTRVGSCASGSAFSNNEACSGDPNYEYETSSAYGGLTEIDYPDGGTAKFNYLPFQSGLGGMENSPTSDANYAYTRALSVTDEWRYDGSKLIAHNTYGISQTANGNQPYPARAVSTGTIDDVTDALTGSTVRHTFTDLANNGKLNQLYETRVDYYSGSAVGTPLKSLTTTYQYSVIPDDSASTTNPTAIDILPQTVTTYLDGNQQKRSLYTYPFLINLTRVTCAVSIGSSGSCGASGSYPIYLSTPTSVKEYGSDGTLLRQTNTDYQYGGSLTSGFGSLNLLNLPSRVSIADGNGQAASSTTYSYDGIGNLTSVTSGSSQWQTEYNGQSMPSAKIDPLGTRTTITYQCNGAYPSNVTVASGTSNAETTNYDHDCITGQVKKVQGPNDTAAGRTGTVYTYNAYGDLTGISYPDSGTAAIDYNGYAPPLAIQTTVAASPDPSIVSRVKYDGFDRSIQKQTTVGGKILYSDTVEYDSAGRVHARWNPSYCDPLSVSSCAGETTWGVTTYSYDALGRVVVQCNPDNGTGDGICVAGSSYKQWQYSGAQTTLYDEKRNQWQYTYDALGNLTQVLEPDGVNQSATLETDYGYDILGNLKSVNQKGSSGSTPRQRSFSYDSLSRLTTATNPETGTTSYTYDAAGNVLSKTDARNITVQYNYDNLSRLSSRTVSSTTVASYGYDGKDSAGNALSVSNAIGKMSYSSNGGSAQERYSYDPMGRLQQVNYCTPQNCTFNNSIAANYDLAGQVRQITYPDGLQVFNQYDAASRLTEIDYYSRGGTPAWMAFAYDPAGHPSSASIGNGLATSGVSYTPRLAASSMNYAVNGSTVWSKLLQWDVAGNLKSSYDVLSGITRSYGYDTLNRLTSAQDSSGGTLNANYSYDPFGNLWKSGNFSFQPSTYSSANRPAGPSFDAAGNETGDGFGNGYAWDVEGRLSASGGVTYVYNANGDRVGKMGSGAMDTLYFNGQPLARLSGGAWTDLVYGSGGLLAEKPTGQATSYRFGDHLGSSIALASTSNSTTAVQDYAPFGELLNGSQNSDPYKFTGKERDAESGNDYFEARYYGSSMGRFMSPDPSGLYYADPTNPQSLNLYAYVRNNPLRFTDPTGLYCAWEDGTSDDDPSDGGATKKQCNQQGGHWTDEKNPCHGMDGCVATFDWNNPQRDKTPTFDPRLDPQLVGVMGALPSQPTVSNVVDPDQARIAALVQGVANDTKSVKCLQEALGKNGISLGLDAAGFIPGESQAAAGAQLGVAGASYVNSLANKDANGAVTSVIGGQITGVGMAQHSLTGSAGKAIPFVGYLVNGYATLHDLGAAQKDYDACMSRP